MKKEEIVSIIKEKTDDFYFNSEIDSYIQGFLDALCKTYEISWEERYEIESILNCDEGCEEE